MKENGKPIRDRLVKTMVSTFLGQNAAKRLDKMDEFVLQELFLALTEKINRSKDELMAVLGREIGNSLASVLKEPLDQLLAGKRLRITLELMPPQPKEDVPQEEASGSGIDHPPAKKSETSPVPAAPPPEDTAKAAKATQTGKTKTKAKSTAKRKKPAAKTSPESS